MEATPRTPVLTLPPDLAAVEGYRAQTRQETPAPPARHTPAEVAARMLAHRPLRKLPEGETIWSMTEHGRAQGELHP